MTVGFLNAGVPFGSVMSFLIASPLLNPIIIGMLAALVGIKAAVIYFVIAFVCSVAFGVILQKIGGQKYVKNVRVKPACCGGGEEVVDKRSLPFKAKLKLAFKAAWDSLRPIMGYLLIGVALGAAIYGYMPEDFVLKIAGPDNPFAVPVAAVLGVPLYIRAETAIPDRYRTDGERDEYRCGHRPDYRRRGNGDSRNVNARQHLQETTCSNDRSHDFPHGGNRWLSV